VDPEDAAQEVLATATRRLGTLRDPKHIEAWLYGITRRVIAGHRRRVWWKRWVSPMPDTLASSNPEADAIALERARRLRDWLERLSSKQREVVVLCRLEERSTAEVAVLLGVPQGTVKSRLRLAMQTLESFAEESL